MVDNENRIEVYKYEDLNLSNIYYDLVKDEFYFKKNENFTPIKWKNLIRKYKYKKMTLIKKRHITIFRN
jgi:hypothetical protein